MTEVVPANAVDRDFVALRQEHSWIRCRSIQMPDQSLLQSVASGLEVLPQVLFLLILDRSEVPRSLNVLCKHFGARHSHDRSCYGQAQGIPEQRAHVCL